MESCFRVPMISIETAVAYVAGAGPRANKPGRKTRVVRLPLAPIVSAIDPATAVEKLRWLYPEAEIGTPEYLHRSRHNEAVEQRAERLARAGFA